MDYSTSEPNATPERPFWRTIPLKTYAGDDFTKDVALYPREIALQKKYIQINSPLSKRYLIFDLDYEYAGAAWYEAGLPEPAWIVTNHENLHAHLIYRLKAPVAISLAARPAPIRFLALVETSMGEILRADPAYAGFLCKNPLHPHWGSLELGTEYTLAELARWADHARIFDLELQQRDRLKRAELTPNFIGRNCTLFDTLRLWAYKAVRDFWDKGYDHWEAAVIDEGLHVADPLLAPDFTTREVRSTARSVAHWTWRNITPEDWEAYIARLIANTHTPDLQRARIAKRWNPQRKTDGLAMLRAGKTVTEVAATLGVNRTTVFRWAKGERIVK